MFSSRLIPLVMSGMLYTATAWGSNYYVDATAGHDDNNGLSGKAAWKTLDKVSRVHFTGGDRIAFKSGQQFVGILSISSSGSKGAPIVYTTYGGNQPAVIDGNGDSTSIYSYNQQYIDLINLSVTNFRKGTMKMEDLFNGIYMVNQDAGTLHHFHFDRITVFNVNSTCIAKDEGKTDQSRFHGGVQFHTRGHTIRSNFDDVLITRCVFDNLSRTGFNFRSDWDDRSANSKWGDSIGKGLNDNWTPNTRVVIRNNLFKNVAGNALIVRVAVNALIEYNVFDSCGKTISGNATFNFNTDSTIYQYNEAKNTVYNEGDVDARGIDSDYRTKHTIIQYNYLHNNGLGGVCAIGGPGIGGDPVNFNIGTIIRYNILENNARQGVYVSGRTEGLEVYNNVIFADTGYNDVIAVKFNRWTVYPNGASFKNNIFYFKGKNSTYDFTGTTNISFDHNIYFGIEPPAAFKDLFPIEKDPAFKAPGKGKNGYRIMANSPAIKAGTVVPHSAATDFYGNKIDEDAIGNIGIDNHMNPMQP